VPIDRYVPDEKTLRQFLLGRLSDAESALVERYIESNPEAAATLHSLSSDDTLTSALRNAPVDVGPEAQAVMERIERTFQDHPDHTTALGDAGTSRELTLSPADSRTDDTEDGLDFLTPPSRKDELGRLGGYRILRVLGTGGMGMVLDAEDPKLGRHVAIKVMRPRVASNLRARDRFVREAQAAAKVEHDHIIPIWYIGEDNGVPYIVMPFLKGESLDERLKRDGRLPIADIVRVGRETAEGLAAAHDMGLVHRDIKPANLWLEAPRGRVKILDFGLARLNSDAGQLTQSGAILGTPAYMAPEQARSQSVDGRSDLFSLGAVLYRAATSRTPFGGTDTMSMLMSLANDTPVDPRSLNPELPPHIANLIMRLLEKDPAKRPQSAREAAALFSPTPIVEPLSTDSGNRRAEFDFDRDDATQIEVPMATAADADANDRKREFRKAGMFVGVAIALLFLAGAGLGAYKLFFETKDGTLIVEVDGDADVRFKNGKVQIYDEKGIPLYTLEPSDLNKTLPPGKYQIKVTGADGLKVNTSEFKLEKGGKTKVYVIVDASWKPAVAKKEAEVGTSQKGETGPAQSIATLLTSADYEWSEPVNLGKAINGGGRQLGASLTADEKIMVFGRDGKLWISRRDSVNDTFERADPLPESINDKTAEVASLSSDGLVLIFSSTRTGSEQEDLWICERKTVNEPFGAPERMPKPVNTRAVERSPFLSADGLTLLVTTTGLGGPGGGDIAMFTRKNRSESFASPSILPATINSPDFDVADWLSPDGCVLAVTRKPGPNPEVLFFVRPDANSPFGLGQKFDGIFAKIHAGHPWLSPDGKRMYFHSRELVDGKGKMELWMSRRVPRTTPDPDRRAAEYVLSIGGTVRVNLSIVDIRESARLPKGPFELTQIWLRGNTKVTDAGLAAFQGCKNLRHLDLSSTSVGDAGMAYFKDCKKLTVIDIPLSKVGDAGIAHFEGCNDLVSLWLGSTKVTDKGLAAFKGCKNLNHVDLVNTGTTDIGLAYFQESKGLANLLLDNTAVTNDGLAPFKDFRFVTLLLGGTKVTDKGLLSLTNVKDLANFNLGDTSTTATGVAHFKECKNLQYLYLTNVPVGDEVLAPFKDCKRLLVLNLDGTGVTDTCALQFKECKDLRDLTFRRTKVSAAALGELQKALPNCKIQIDGGVFEPKQAVDPDRQLAEWVIKRGGRLIIADGPKTANVGKIEELFPGLFAVQGVTLSETTDADFKELARLIRVGLRNNSIELGFSKLSVSDDSLNHLAGLSIHKLFLHATPFGDSCTQYLIKIKDLRSLTIWNSKLTEDGVKRLAASLPNCAIDSTHGKFGFPVDEPFVPLFNGKDLTNWQTYDGPIKGWIVQDGELVGTGSGSHLFSWPTIVEDFHLKMEAKISAGGIATIHARSSFTPNPPGGYQWKLSAADGDPLRTGTIHNVAAVVDKTHKADEWVTLELIAKGEQIASHVNGKPVVSFKNRRFTSGTLALAVLTPGATARFRKIELKHLPPATPRRVLSLDDSKLIFSGESADSWRTFENDMKGWRLDGGSLVSTGNSRSLYFDSPYQNFHMRAEVFVAKGSAGIIGLRGALIPDEEGPQHYAVSVNGDPASKTPTGSLLGIANAKEMPGGVNEWVAVEAICHGDRIVTKVNNQVVLEAFDRRFHAGRVSFANKSTGVFKIRKVEIRDLSPTMCNRDGMQFALVPRGKSWLGGGNGKPGDRELEFKDDFYMGVYEITQHEWERVTGKNPSYFSRAGGGKKEVESLSDANLKRLPVDSVSWEQAHAFITLLNVRDKRPGWTYRLPTSEEWEYACRGGPIDRAQSAFDFYLSSPSNSAAKQFHCSMNDAKRTERVGSYQPNRLGLHDMHGNVWEWCNEGGGEMKGVDMRKVRGGGWDATAAECRALQRTFREVNLESKSLGLRLVRVRDDAANDSAIEKK
jgi:serine/threonine protein kinase/formylglycine-generating enzyme required for sulfatase activity